jgi:hypothetical protein
MLMILKMLPELEARIASTQRHQHAPMVSGFEALDKDMVLFLSV